MEGLIDVDLFIRLPAVKVGAAAMPADLLAMVNGPDGLLNRIRLTSLLNMPEGGDVTTAAAVCDPMRPISSYVSRGPLILLATAKEAIAPVPPPRSSSAIAQPSPPAPPDQVLGLTSAADPDNELPNYHEASRAPANPARHVHPLRLIPWSPGERRRCDICHADLTDAPSSNRCPLCNYDECGACVLLTRSEVVAAGPAWILGCAKATTAVTTAARKAQLDGYRDGGMTKERYIDDLRRMGPTALPRLKVESSHTTQDRRRADMESSWTKGPSGGLIPERKPGSSHALDQLVTFYLDPFCMAPMNAQGPLRVEPRGDSDSQPALAMETEKLDERR
ncbi:hypothetical protein HK101_002373, partial [Irineochytrium annulatum]